MHTEKKHHYSTLTNRFLTNMFFEYKEKLKHTCKLSIHRKKQQSQFEHTLIHI